MSEINLTDSIIEVKNIALPPVCEKEVLRYAGAKDADEGVMALLKDCLAEVGSKLKCMAVYGIFDVKCDGDVCDFGHFKVFSEKLAINLNGCEKAVVFACTVGIELDRLIAKYVRLSPSKALMLQAVGAERIEAVCDVLCALIEKEYGIALATRFSPGYGDVSLEVQKNIFDILGCPKRIGVTLTDGMLMIPSKSVTAFAGVVKNKQKHKINKCGECEKKDCAFRRDL